MSAAPKESRRTARPWYREVWPWLLMLPPALSVAGGVTMVVLATHTPSALVVEDYARIEELTSERFERDRAAVSLGVAAEIVFEPETGRISLGFLAPVSFERPRALILGLHHATNAEADREIRLERFGERYRGTGEWTPGRYYIELEPEDRAWRLGAGPDWLEGEVLLRPQDAGG